MKRKIKVMVADITDDLEGEKKPNLVSFGYAFKSLADLTCESAKGQKADKLRKDSAHRLSSLPLLCES